MEAEMAYLLEEQGREIATLVKRLANAEMLIEKLKEEVRHWEENFAMFDRAHEKAIAPWRKEHPDAGYTPDMIDMNEWLAERVEKAEAVKESLTSSLLKISGFSAFWKGFRGNENAWENVWNVATDALISLRTAEESSVVDLIDSTPAKQFPNAENADGDGDSVIDDNPMQVELDREKRKNEDLYRDFKGANDLYLAENMRAEKFQDALLQIRHLAWKNSFLSSRKRLRNLLTDVFSIAYKALKVEE